MSQGNRGGGDRGRGRGRGGRGSGPHMSFQDNQGGERRPLFQSNQGGGAAYPTRGNGGATAPPGQDLISSFGGEPRRPDRGVTRPHVPPGGVPAPHPKVKQIEQDYVKQFGTDIAKLKVGDSMPYRPNYGTIGAATRVFTNFMAVTIEERLVLGQYSIGTPKELDNKKRKRADIVAAAIKLIPGYNQLEGKFATDYAGILISIGPIIAVESAPEVTKDNVLAPTLTITVPDIRERLDEDATPLTSGKTFDIVFRPVRQHNFRDILGYLRSATGAHQDYEEKFQTMQILNIFLGHFARGNEKVFMKSSGQRNKFWHKDTERIDIGGMLEALKGFVSSIRPATGRFLLNVNNASIAAYKPLSLLHIMQTLREGKLSPGEIARFLKGVRVRRTWLEKKNKKGEIVAKDKSVWGFAAVRDKGKRVIDGKEIQTVRVRSDAAGANNVEFLLDGKWITVANYFKKQYNLTIQNPNVPVVNLGSQAAPVYAPAELCVVMDGQDYRMKLDAIQTDNMLRFAVNQPWFNFTYIEHRAPPVLGLNSSLLKAAGITIEPKLITVEARVLPAPIVSYLSKKITPKDGSWNMDNTKCMVPGRVPDDWRIIVIDGGGPNNLVAAGRPSSSGQQLARDIVANLLKLGIRNVQMPPVAATLLPLQSDEATFDNAVSKFLDSYKKTAFLLILLPRRLPEWQYKRLKYFADIKYGIATVCIAVDKLQRQKNDKAFAQYVANVGLKVNAKFGGSNQGPDQQKLSFITKGKTMLVGLDVTHPAPGSKASANSVAAMVANTDGTLGQWPAILELNGERIEEVSTIEKMLSTRLDLWKTKGNNKVLPENIMFFRDGVSEGQFQRVLRLELPQIRDAIQKKYGQSKPPRLFIAVCGKRHQVRFAPARTQDCDSSNNCIAGLVVDSGITETRVWDFYLQAHKAIQGTARSCHYTVLLDEIFSDPKAVAEFNRPGVSKADLLQEMCNALAYTYPRATKAVSLSTPAKLADLACDRARAYISKFIDSVVLDDAGSTSSSATNDLAQQAAAITLHPRLKDTMFYI